MWYYEVSGSQQGPIEASEVHRRLDSGELSGQTLVWREGMVNWLPLGQVSELMRVPAGGMMPQPYPGHHMNPAMMPPSLNGLALGSLITGILSLVAMTMCIGFVFGIPAVILGHLGRGQIRRSAVPQTGDGLAVTGLVTGYLSLVLTLGFIIAMAVGFSTAAKSIPRTSPTVFPTPSPSSSPSLPPSTLPAAPEMEEASDGL